MSSALAACLSMSQEHTRCLDAPRGRSKSWSEFLLTPRTRTFPATVSHWFKNPAAMGVNRTGMHPPEDAQRKGRLDEEERHAAPAQGRQSFEIHIQASFSRMTDALMLKIYEAWSSSYRTSKPSAPQVETEPTGQKESAVESKRKRPARNASTDQKQTSFAKSASAACSCRPEAAYAVNKKPDEALELFQRATTRNAVPWNIVLNAHASFYGARPCFMRYPCWDSYSTTILRHFAIAELKAAVASSDLEDVRAQYFKAFCYDDGYVDAIIRSSYTSLMHSLGTHGHLVDVAENVYKRIPSPDAAAFNALLAVYVKNGYYWRAQKLFAEGGGDRIDTRSFNIMISSLPLLEDSEALFERAKEKDVFTWTSLASAYVQNNRAWNNCTRLRLRSECLALWPSGHQPCPRWEVCSGRGACKLFARRSVNWMAVLSAARMVDNVVYGEIAAEKLLRLKSDDDKSPTVYIMLGSIYYNTKQEKKLKEILGKIKKLKLRRIPGISTVEANGIGRKMPRLRTPSLTAAALAMLLNCGTNHEESESVPENYLKWMSQELDNEWKEVAIQTLARNKDVQIHEPNGDRIGSMVVDFGKYKGLFRDVDSARAMFDRMDEPDVVSVNAMLWAYAQNGHLQSAVDFFYDKSKHKDIVTHNIMHIVYAACGRKHVNAEHGKYAAEQIFAMDATPYIIYGKSGRTDEIAGLRKMVTEKGLKKLGAISRVQVSGKMHTFRVGDRSHPSIKEIRGELTRLMKLAKDVKEENFWHPNCNKEGVHSEKLAIAYALLQESHKSNVLMVNSFTVSKEAVVLAVMHGAVLFIQSCPSARCKFLLMPDENLVSWCVLYALPGSEDLGHPGTMLWGHDLVTVDVRRWTIAVEQGPQLRILKNVQDGGTNYNHEGSRSL
ncbi:hypothetical protein SELMODRAFT_425365 [Selaginella moellendorffii]|uniref:DYW domain-containing protein n=1 Tax=Selaginella moellendorffii TaxID=88036 RepID=D8SSV8_SELML|nr:hypothetical protein SELMODRAFT_425365 [Selaginella moellendorffii]